MFDWVVETRASDELISKAVRVLRPGGQLILKSRFLDHIKIPLRDVVQKRISLIGQTQSDFGVAMDWLTKNEDFVQTLIGDVFHLNDWEIAFDHARQGEGLKTFILVSDEE